MKPGPSVVGAQSLSHWITREVPCCVLLMYYLRNVCLSPGPEDSVLCHIIEAFYFLFHI